MSHATMKVKFHATMHWKLQSFDFLLQLYYRLIAGVTKWGESDKVQLGFVKIAKKEAQDHLVPLGLPIDMPTSEGGNTNNGSMAERFLSPDIRDNVCSIIKNTEARENFSILLRDVNIILTVTQGSRDDVDTQKLKQLGIDIMSHLKTSFLTTRNKLWIAVNPSLHSMCAHSWELFTICTDGPLAQYSEQAQEHWNKYVRRFKSGSGARARQHNVSLNIADIFSRMLCMSHPCVASKRRVITCTECGQEGHTSRSTVHHGYGPVTLERTLIDSYYVQ